MGEQQLSIRGLRVRGVLVPMRRPLVTAGGQVSQVPLALVDLDCGGGITGSAYVFTYHAFALGPTVRLLEELGELIEGEPLAPALLADTLRARLRLLGQQGLAMLACAGLDMAAWDALAKARGVSLARLLGGAPSALPAYNSNGLGIIGPKKIKAEAQQLVAEGFDAIKLRLGYPDPDDDLRVYLLVRDAVGDAVRVMTDYNQCLSAPDAERRARLFDDAGPEWIEEPVRFDDYAGCARVRHASPVPIQLGENCWGVHDMQKALDAGAGDLFMADAGKIGGVTGWLRAAGLADGCGMPLSSHLYPEISAHLLAATPTRHWLEFVDWAQPILKAPLTVEQGHITVPDAPGAGIEWDEAAVRQYAV